MLSPSQREFMSGQLFAMTLAAATQRSNMYAAELTEAERKPVQKTLRSLLDQICAHYSTTVGDERHLENIVQLAREVTAAHSSLLEAGRMKLGHAQKALNLHLKYLWCSEQLLQPPPHCPIDSIILRKIPGFTQLRWTQLDEPVRYMEVIAAARLEAKKKNLSICEWELVEYNLRDASQETPAK
jgi:hypothetical protein